MVVERGLSARRTASGPPALEAEATAAFGGGDGNVDESKSRRHASLSFRLARNVTGMVATTRPGLLAAFLFLLVLPVAVFIYLSPPRFRASPSVDGTDSLASIDSEFGILGVPWCKPFFLSSRSFARLRVSVSEGIDS